MTTLPSFEDLVQQVYGAAVRPALWQDFLHSLSHAVTSESTVFHLQQLGRPQQGQVVAAVGVDEQAQRRYRDYYAAVNVWTRRGAPLLRDGAVLTGEMVCPNAELERSEYYADYLRPLGLYHSLASVAAGDHDSVLIISCLRSKALGTFAEESVGLLRALTPHLRQAAHIHKRLTEAQVCAGAQAEVLDMLPIGVLLVDGRRRVLMANRHARRATDASDGLVLGKAGLAAQLPTDAAHLDALLARATRGPGGARTGGVMKVSRPSGLEPFEVLVTPLATPDAPHDSWSQAAVAIFVVDPSTGGCVDTDALRELHGLTASEVRVAAALVAGHRIEEIAEQRRLARDSVRWLVKQVLHKTGARTQAQAVIRILKGIGIVERRGSRGT